MRINQFVAQATGLSRRSTDRAILEHRVKVNDVVASLGQIVEMSDDISLDNKLIKPPKLKTILLINKPVGYVCSRDGQGSPTIYDLVPSKYQKLKHVGRLDKDSSGIVVLTDDGNLAHNLSHPKFDKVKVYSVELDRPLTKSDKELIETGKIKIGNKPSIMKVSVQPNHPSPLKIELREGRNRQIRRTFAKLNYEVINLRRDSIGPYSLRQLNNHTYINV